MAEMSSSERELSQRKCLSWGMLTLHVPECRIQIPISIQLGRHLEKIYIKRFLNLKLVI